jgi:cell division protein FtsB
VRKQPWVGKAVLAVVALTAIAFAVQGGEFGTTDLVSQQLRKRKLATAIDSLERRVDSLTQVKQAIENDPRVQERIAREEFGMVKGDREVLYRFADP